MQGSKQNTLPRHLRRVCGKNSEDCSLGSGEQWPRVCSKGWTERPWGFCIWPPGLRYPISATDQLCQTKSCRQSSTMWKNECNLAKGFRRRIPFLTFLCNMALYRLVAMLEGNLLLYWLATKDLLPCPCDFSLCIIRSAVCSFQSVATITFRFRDNLLIMWNALTEL